MNAMAQFFRRKQSLRRAETGPSGGDDQKSVLRAQILRDQAHRRAVAAVARDHHELPDAGARDAFAERHPALQRDFGRQRQRARIVDMLGGNPDRLQRQEGHRDVVGQQLAHPREIGLRDHDVGAEGQMRTVLLGRRQRQHRDPLRRRGLGNAGPVDVGPVAGREQGSHRAKCFFKRVCKVVCTVVCMPSTGRSPSVRSLSWAKTIDGVQS